MNRNEGTIAIDTIYDDLESRDKMSERADHSSLG